jgi:hypothetical protein
MDINFPLYVVRVTNETSVVSEKCVSGTSIVLHGAQLGIQAEQA